MECLNRTRISRRFAEHIIIFHILFGMHSIFEWLNIILTQTSLTMIESFRCFFSHIRCNKLLYNVSIVSTVTIVDKTTNSLIEIN